MKTTITVLAAICCLTFINANAQAATFASVKSGFASDPCTWNSGASCASGSVPGMGDDIVVSGGHSVFYPDVMSGIGCQNLTVDSGGTLNVGTGSVLPVRVNAVINGTLTGAGGMEFDGPSFINNGQVTIAGIGFDNTATILAQTLSGADTWGAGGGLLTILPNSTTTMLNAIDLNSFALTVQGTLNTNNNDLSVGANLEFTSCDVQAGGTLNAGTSTVTVKTQFFNINGAINGSGVVKTSGVGVGVNLTNAGILAPALQIATGTTNAKGAFSSPITVLSGGTLIQQGAEVVTANNDFTINAGGTLSESFSGVYYFNGATFTNNGTISVGVDLRFDDTATPRAQTVQGTGTWGASGVLSIKPNSTTTVAGGLDLGGTALTVEGTFILGGTLTVHNTVNVAATGTLAVGGNTLNVIGNVMFGNGGAVTGNGVVKFLASTPGATLSNLGSFAPTCEATTGVTLAKGTFNGPIVVQSGASFQVQGFELVTANNNITVNGGGMLLGFIFFNGSTLTNNGLVGGVATLRFGETAPTSLTQTITGSGSWTGSGELLIRSNSTTTINSAIDLDQKDLVVEGSLTLAANLTVRVGSTVGTGATLGLGSHTLDLIGNLTFTNNGAITGSGTIKCEATTPSLTFGNTGTVAATLEATSGTTFANGSYNGPIVVRSGATLSAISFDVITANNDITVDSGGTLAGFVIFKGSVFTNNGTVSGQVNFNGGMQSLTGAGSVTGQTFVITGATVTLGSDHQLNALSIDGGATFDQRTTHNLTAGPISNSGLLRNLGSGDLILKDYLSNSGTVQYDSEGGGCGSADTIRIRSSFNGMQRQWTGGGAFSLIDVDVKDQAGDAAITVINGTDSGNNGVNWVFNPTTVITLDRTHQSFAGNGGGGTITVTASNAICSWSASASSPFITITSGGPGSGNGMVQYSVAANTGSIIRSGTITVGDKTFTVYQGINFADVPSNHLFYTEIGKLSARGVTLGCGNGTYCSNDAVTREQMAAFVMRAKGEFNPPTPSTQRFNDVPSSNQFYNFIDKLAVLQITVGCSSNPPRYCPTDPVDREQIAAFIVRALGEFNPPPPATQRFNDVPPGNQFYNFIDRLAELQITLGCSTTPPLFCPNDSVTRGQAAAFLVRAFDL
jgi:hypothetical protein